MTANMKPFIKIAVFLTKNVIHSLDINNGHAYHGILNFIIDNETNDNLAVSSDHENQGSSVVSSDHENKLTMLIVTMTSNSRDNENHISQHLSGDLKCQFGLGSSTDPEIQTRIYANSDHIEKK